MLTKHVNIFKVEGLPQFTVGGLFLFVKRVNSYIQLQRMISYSFGRWGEQQLLESFRVKGTVESWIENVFNLVKNRPKADMEPIVLDVSGESSRGKSGLLLLCASVWGCSKE
ncbi:hypothetical protein [Peribacillus frigoritolerans]